MSRHLNKSEREKIALIAESAVNRCVRRIDASLPWTLGFIDQSERDPIIIKAMAKILNLAARTPRRGRPQSLCQQIPEIIMEKTIQELNIVARSECSVNLREIGIATDEKRRLLVRAMTKIVNARAAGLPEIVSDGSAERATILARPPASYDPYLV